MQRILWNFIVQKYCYHDIFAAIQKIRTIQESFHNGDRKLEKKLFLVTMDTEWEFWQMFEKSSWKELENC